jgi:flagellar assembly protein FliH
VRTAREEAYARGLEDGTAAGIASAEERIRAAEGALQRAAAALTGARDEFTRRRTRNLEALALAVAHHLVGREVAADPDLLRGLTARALELATDDEVEVRLHPDDLSLLAPHLDALTPKETTPVARWIADASMARGGVRVDGPLRLVDGRIETALRHLYERLDHD